MNIVVIAVIFLALAALLACFVWASRRPRSLTDAECLEIMRQDGVDLSVPRMLEFLLVFPSREAAVDAEPAVAAAGYETHVSGGPGAPRMLLAAKKMMVPTKAGLLAVRMELVALARQLGGRYEGCFPRP